MELAVQYPLPMRADPDVVEVVAGSTLKSWDARTGVARPDQPRPGIALADGASVAPREVEEDHRRSVHQELSWGARKVEKVRSAAFVGGVWWALDPDGLVRLSDNRRWAMEDARLLAAAGDELVVLRDDRLAWWADGKERCSVELGGKGVSQVLADPTRVLVASGDGVLIVDHACVPRGNVAVRGQLWAVDGGRLWSWGNGQLRQWSPDFTALQTFTRRGARAPELWKLGDSSVGVEDGHVVVTGKDGVLLRDVDGAGLTGLSAAAQVGDTIAVTDGRVVRLLGGPTWTAGGIVTRIDAVGPAGVTVSVKPRVDAPAVPVTFGTVPVTSDGLVVARPPHPGPGWGVPAFAPLPNPVWAAPAPLAPVSCGVVPATLEGGPLDWSFTRTTLVAAKLLGALPAETDALSPAGGRNDDLHAVGIASEAALAAACHRPLGAEAWVIGAGGRGSAYASVPEAERTIEAAHEGWAGVPYAVATAAWAGVPDATLHAHGAEVLVAGGGSAVFGADGPRLRFAGTVVDGGTSWLVHAGGVTAVVDAATDTLVDVVAGDARAGDSSGVTLATPQGNVRVALGSTRGEPVWGPRPDPGTVAGWTCTATPATGAETCARSESVPVTVGGATAVLTRRALVLTKGHKELLRRDDIDRIVVAGDTLLVRAHGPDRPWVRYDAAGRPISVLPPGDVLWLDGALWSADATAVRRFPG